MRATAVHLRFSICVLLASAVLSVAVSGAARGTSVSGTSVVSEGVVRLPGPRPLAIASLAWLAGSRELFVSATLDRFRSNWIYVVRPSAREPEWWRLPVNDPGCVAQNIWSPEALGRDRLLYVNGCTLPGLRSSEHVVVFDRVRAQRRSLFFTSLLPNAGDVQAPLVGGRLLFNDGNGLYERLRWLGPRGISAPIGLGLERIDRADLDPAGTLLAFTGVHDIENRDGVSRAFTRNWHVYVSGIALHKRRPLLRERFDEAPELAWAADGETLAITVASTERAGRLLLVSRNGARTTVALRGNLGSLTWIGPTRIALVDMGANQDLNDDTILLVDVRRALADLVR